MGQEEKKKLVAEMEAKEQAKQEEKK